VSETSAVLENPPRSGSALEPVKALLINPPSPDLHCPLGLAYIAAVVRDEFPVKLVQLEATVAQAGDAPSYFMYRQYHVQGVHVIERCIEKEGFNVIGLTGLTYQANFNYALARHLKAKYPWITVLYGGIHATFCYKEALASGAVDVVCVREGEYTFQDLLRSIRSGEKDWSRIDGIAYQDEQGQVQITPHRKVGDINELPFPAKDLIPIYGYERTIVDGPGAEADGTTPAKANPYGLYGILGEMLFSRGCPADCDFCGSPQFYLRKFRCRTPELIVAELKHCIENFGLKHFSIVDDVFTLNHKIMRVFCELVKPLKITWTCLARADHMDLEMIQLIKKAGCIMVSYGVESGSQRVLDQEHKNQDVDHVKDVFRWHREAGLPATALMIVGHAGETVADLKASYEYLRSLQPFAIVCQMMTPYPGTRLFDEVAEKAGTILTKDWDEYIRTQEPIFLTNSLTREELLYWNQQIKSLVQGWRPFLGRAWTVGKLLNTRLLDRDFLRFTVGYLVTPKA
jgi:radical SAM superfamily enzyme YgiQ (UPF0313 family)